MKEHILSGLGTINSISDNPADGVEEYYRNSFVTLACETNYEYLGDK